MGVTDDFNWLLLAFVYIFTPVLRTKIGIQCYLQNAMTNKYKKANLNV